MFKQATDDLDDENEDHYSQMIALYGELFTSQRNRGAPKKRYKCCLKIPLPQVMLIIYTRQTWQQTVMPGAIQSSKWLTCLKTGEMRNKTSEGKGKLELPPTPHLMLLSHVDTAHGPTFPTYNPSVMSMPADCVDRLPNLCS